MINLMRKDLILNRNMLIWFFVLIAVSLLLPLLLGDAIPAVLVLGAFIVAMASITIVAREDRFNATPFACSLPATRKEIVVSRYCLSWIFFIAFLGLAFVFGRVLTWLALPAVSLNTQVVLLSLAAFTTSVSVLLPMVIRFGFSGMIYTLVGLQVLGIAAMGLSQSKANPQALVRGLGIWVQELHGTLRAPLLILLLILLLATVNGLSFSISYGLFRRKDL